MVDRDDEASRLGSLETEPVLPLVGPSDPKWRVQVLPLEVGVRGILDAISIQQAKTFLELSASKRKDILLRKSAAASVKALVYIHKVKNKLEHRE